MASLFNSPFALSIGPQRSGADFLQGYFKAREDVCLPKRVEEVFFFDRHFQRGAEFYTGHFTVEDHHALVLELTTTIFDAQEAPQHLQDMVGDDVKLFCILRHPLDRAFAVYQDLTAYGIVNGEIEEAVEQAPQILYASRYHLHLERWFQVFGQDKIKIFAYEDFCENPAAIMEQLCSFLSIPNQPIPDDIEQPTMLTPTEPEAAWLRERLQDDIKLYNSLISA